MSSDNKTIIYLPPMNYLWEVKENGHYIKREDIGRYDIDFRGINIKIRSHRQDGCHCGRRHHNIHDHICISIDYLRFYLVEHYNSWRTPESAKVKTAKYDTYMDISTEKGHIYLIPRTVSWTDFWKDATQMHEKKCEEFHMIIGADKDEIDALVEEYGGLDDSVEITRDMCFVI